MSSTKRTVTFLDVAGETLVAWRMFDDARPPAGTLVLPAIGFFGGLGDLLATAAFGDGGVDRSGPGIFRRRSAPWRSRPSSPPRTW
ncbi:hypothetical protein [Winogradskya consettensis]|uniref:hypothetical protein n=1 Tax=Winogradskya consettensis TaxID=113560 RepID=UPI001BB30647|nr:hypothetical protein [Actinoplanes consettensis]